MEKLKVAFAMGAVCDGCATSLLDIHEKLLDILEKVEFVYCQILMDVKEVPEDVDIGLWAGTVRTEEERELIIDLRDKCKTFIAWGTCATYGGLPGLCFYWPIEEMLEKVYTRAIGLTNPQIPSKLIPKLVRELYPADGVVDVDYYIPGCPVPSDFILRILPPLLEGKKPEIEHKTVCSECPRRMTRPAESIKRKLGKFDESIVVEDRQRCFLSQGMICMGTVTISRCGAVCRNEGMPCIGCSGPSIEVLREQARDPFKIILKRYAILRGADPEAVISGEIPPEIEEEFYDLRHQFYAFVSTHPAIWRKAVSKIPDMVEVK